MKSFEVILQRSIKTYKKFHEDRDPPKNNQTDIFLKEIQRIPLDYLSDIIFREDCCHVIYMKDSKKFHVYYDYDCSSVVVVLGTEGKEVLFDKNFARTMTKLIANKTDLSQ